MGVDFSKRELDWSSLLVGDVKKWWDTSNSVCLYVQFSERILIKKYFKNAATRNSDIPLSMMKVTLRKGKTS